MLSNRPASPRRTAAVLSFLTLVLASCVDGPSVPTDELEGTGPALAFAPAFQLVGPDGGTVVNQEQADALSEAFDRVNRFRVVVRRDSNQQVVLDTLVSVQPGEDVYDFRFNVAAVAGETFSVSLTAFEGETELFEAEDIKVQAIPPSGGSTSEPPPTNVTMRYSGPGTDAQSVQVTPGQLVLAPGGAGTLTHEVQDADGNAISGVPVAWSTSAADVATVTAGSVQAVADGLAQVTVTTPTGLQAGAWVYVVAGEVAYVQAGALMVRGAAGGDAEVRGDGAGAPAWSADGARLYYVSGGSVRLAGSSDALLEGDWPSLSPDGTKLAVERGGRIYFANEDGTHPTAGPEGSTPVWDDDATLLVGGGSVHRVGADGADRETVAGGDAALPARSPSGRVAYVEDGELFVEGSSDELLTDVRGRATWSANGRWLIAPTGSGLMVVPASGEAPGAPLPGLESAGDPAFRPTGSLSSPPSVRVTGFDPAEPVPGEPVRILGSGFDWIIPANNHVVWPTDAGTVESEVRSVSREALETEVPRDVIAGQVRVETRSGQALLAFEPTLGSIEIVAATGYGAPVPGVKARLTDADGAAVDSTHTDDAGEALFSRLLPGTYGVDITAPEGFTLESDARYTFELGARGELIELELTPEVDSLVVTPEALAVEVGQSLDVTLEAYDVLGRRIPELRSSRWQGSLPTLGASGSDFEGRISGRSPSDAEGGSVLALELNGKVFIIRATVTSYIEGEVTQDPDPSGSAAATASTAAEGEGSGGAQGIVSAEPGADYLVSVYDETGERLVGSARTQGDGSYKVAGLFAGTYVVSPGQQRDRNPVPFSITVTLDADNPTGEADFFMSLAPVDSIALSAPPDSLIDALDGTIQIVVESFDSLGNPLPGRIATFTSLDPAVATVAADGTVTAVANGSVAIEVQVEAQVDTIWITVDQKAVSIEAMEQDWDAGGALIPAPDSARALEGDTATAFYEARDRNGYLIPASHEAAIWTSSSPSALSLSPQPDGSAAVNVIEATDVLVIVELDGVADTVLVAIFTTHGGDLVVTDAPLTGEFTPADVAANRIGRVTGHLLVQSTGLVNLDGLQTIWEVWGDVRIENNAALTDITGLGGLEDVAGSVVFFNNDALTTPTSPVPAALMHVGGSVLVEDNALLTNLDVFSNLNAIDGDLVIGMNPAFNDADLFPNVIWVGGTIWLYQNPALSSTGMLPNVQGIGGSLIIEAGAAVAGFPALTTVTGHVVAGGSSSAANTVLEELHLPALQCTGGDFYVYDNQVLHTVLAPSLTDVGDEACMAEPPPPPSPVSGAQPSRWSSRVLEAERAFASPRTGRYHPAVAPGPDPEQRIQAARERARARKDSIEAVRARMEAERHALEAHREAERDVRRAERQRTRGAVRPDEGGALHRIRGALDGGNARIRRSKPERPERPARVYTGFGDLDFWGNPALATLDVGAVTSVSGSVYFGWGNELLTSVSFPDLGWIGGDLYLDQTVLTLAEFPVLTGIGGTLLLQNNPDLSDVSLASMASAESIRLIDLSVLTDLAGLGGLTTVSGDIEVRNTGLVNLDDLAGVTSALVNVYVDANPALTSIAGLANLGSAAPSGPSVSGTFSITNNPMLCDTDVDAVIAAIEAHHPEPDFGTTPVNSGNQICGGNE